MAISTTQIGRLGELLVQQKFLEKGIDSSALTTDSGIDLVALCPNVSFTFQVKTCFKDKPAGGKKGKPSIDWYIPIDCPADFIALVYYAKRYVWIITKSDLDEFSRDGFCQKTPIKYHLSMYVDFNPNATVTKYMNFFDTHRFESKLKKFGNN